MNADKKKPYVPSAMMQEAVKRVHVAEATEVDDGFAKRVGSARGILALSAAFEFGSPLRLDDEVSKLIIGAFDSFIVHLAYNGRNLHADGYNLLLLLTGVTQEQIDASAKKRLFELLDIARTKAARPRLVLHSNPTQ